MNLTLFLIILIAFIIIFCIILYNGIRILLTVGKEKGIVKYEFKVTILKIPIFKRTGTKGILEIIKSKGSDGDSEENGDEKDSEEEKSLKTKKESSEEGLEEEDRKSQEEIPESEDEDEKGLREKYKEIKPILNELKKSKEELKDFLNNILKAIDLKKLEGHLIIGLSDHTTTVKIASWIWSIGAIVNSSRPTLLTVEPIFTEVIIDFEGKIELKINLLLLIIHSLILLTKKNIRELIKVIYRQYKSPSEEEGEAEEEEKDEEKTDMVEEYGTSEDEGKEENKTSENDYEEDAGVIEVTENEEKEEKIEEQNGEEEAVTQVKQLMKIIRSD